MKIKNILLTTPFLLLSILTNNATAATSTPTVEESIIGLYTAYYNRAPDQDGFNYWNNQASLNGNSSTLLSISQQFINHPKFREDYPNHYSNTEFMTKIYINVLNRVPDSDGLNFWVAVLDSGLSKPEVIVNFTQAILSDQTDEVGLVSQRMFSNKINVGQYYMDRLGSASNGEPESLSYRRSIDALACVTEENTTVNSAKELIRHYITNSDPVESSCESGINNSTGNPRPLSDYILPSI